MDVRILVSNPNLINALIFSDPMDIPWQITGVYGPPIPSLRKFFWEALDNIAAMFTGPWLLIGDFNTVI